MQQLAAVIGTSHAGLVKAALELAARHILDQAPGTPQGSVAETFLRESYATYHRNLWAAPMGLDLPVLGRLLAHDLKGHLLRPVQSSMAQALPVVINDNAQL